MPKMCLFRSLVLHFSWPLRLLHRLKAVTGGSGKTSLCSSEFESIQWRLLTVFPTLLNAGWYAVTNRILSPLPGLGSLPVSARRVSLSNLRTLSICSLTCDSSYPLSFSHPAKLPTLSLYWRSSEHIL